MARPLAELLGVRPKTSPVHGAMAALLGETCPTKLG